MNRRPLLIIEYRDPEEGFPGWLVINDLPGRLCAGGMRVQPGLSRRHVIDMARNMSLKMRVCGLPIGGAKCGIDYDPAAPGKKAAMRRFMEAIKPYVATCYSMGPDLNTTMDELEEIAATIGLASVKTAIAKAQGMPLDVFQRRYAVLGKEALPGRTLGGVRAGYGVAMAALALMARLGIPPSTATVAVQGFGTLAKAAMAGLAHHGVGVNAIADAHRAIILDGSDLSALQVLLSTPGTLLPLPLPPRVPARETRPADDVLYLPCDILVLAAIENVITAANADRIRAKAVVPGANLAVSPEAEEILHQRGVVVLPSFLAGCGGSLSMNGLFGPSRFPSAKDVLSYIETAMRTMVDKIMEAARRDGQSPTQAAFACMKHVPRRETPYLVTDNPP